MSAICEYTYWLPVCGANGPPGLEYRLDAQPLNCGYADLGRMPLVDTNDALMFWLSAPSGPNAHDRPPNGSAMPSTAKWSPVSGSCPSRGTNAYAPNQYWSTSLIPSLFGEPASARHRRGSNPTG